VSDPAKDDGAAPPPPKGGLSTKVVVLLLAVNVTIGAGSVAAQFFHSPKAEAPAAAAEKKPEDKNAPFKDKNGVEIPRPAIKLDTLTVRLRNPEVDRYARSTFIIELSSPEDNNAFKLVTPQIQDAVLTLLADRDSTDLAGAAALQKLKSDIFERAELIFGKGRIHAVYISEFIIQ
jgi:flagellar basal body-associated protein FliL